MYDPGIKVGDIVTNEEMRSAFAVGNMGGMRKSNTHNCLVLISDHTKGLYEDKWYGDELHYTGIFGVSRTPRKVSELCRI